MPHQETLPPVLHAEGLTKKYGRRTALDGADFSVPQGSVVGLVGPNGAGKSTLLHMACGLLEPTSGRLRVLGERPAANPAHLARVGFVAQNAPVYGTFSVAEHLRMGARMNPSWDARLAERRITRAGLDPAQKAGGLSGGQRAQLALTVAAAKRPDLLIFDEPAAALDPLAREGFLKSLTEFVAELGASAVLSSHLLGDVEQVCDHIILLGDSRVQLTGNVRELLAVHRRVPTRGVPPVGGEVIRANGEHAIVRIGAVPPQHAAPVTLEELVLAYMTRAAGEVRR